MRQTVSHSLRSAGAEVLDAEDGVDDPDKARRKQVQPVLADQNMPRMDGLTLVQSLRALPDYQTVPIFILIAESSAEMKTKEACCRCSRMDGEVLRLAAIDRPGQNSRRSTIFGQMEADS